MNEQPEPTDPTQCTGEEGSCPQHGFHRHSLKQSGETHPTTPPAPAGTDLRDRIAHAIEDAQSPQDWSNAEELAAAALSVLPAPADRAAEEDHRLTLSEVLGLGTGAPWDAIRDRAAEVHRAHVPADRAAVLREAADAIDFDWGGPDHDDAWSVARDKLRRMADEAQPEPTVCGPVPELCDAEAGEPCANHEREQAHAEGEHCFCGPECEPAAEAQRVPLPHRDATVAADMCPRCKGDNSEAWQVCATCTQADEEQPAEAEPLVQVGWWCWRCNGLVEQACRSDNVPIHVPAQWADDMRELIQRRTDGDEQQTEADR